MPARSWDAEVDVLVIGGGCGGMSAAVEASAAEADVLVVERSGAIGGASAMAGGLIYMGGGTPVQKACGFEDSAEEMYKYLVAATSPGADLAKIEAYCEGSLDHFDWLVRCGVPFKSSFYSGMLSEPPGDDGLMYSGGENAYPFNEIARPAPRGHVPQMPGADKVIGERGSGWMLMKSLGEVAARQGVKTQCDTRANELVVDGDGRVIGAVVRSFGTDSVIKARRGVVLSGGGFAFNDDMLALHAPRMLGHSKVGTDHDDGKTIRLGQSVGAAVKHMDATTAYAALPPLLVRSIIVNASGSRFINEDQYFGRVGEAAFYREEGEAYLVFDEEGFESVPPEEIWGQRPTWVCETIAELETEMGVPAGALEVTVDFFNRHAEHGEDPLFHRDAKWLRPMRSPFGAIDLRQKPGPTSPEHRDGPGYSYSFFTLGGLHTSPEGRVLNTSGEPIPGLFAAGRTTSGLPAGGYASGCSIGDGTFFGRRAGGSAARST
jgi:3-oxo-5alpha-steroid 4-dehydrogenase